LFRRRYLPLTNILTPQTGKKLSEALHELVGNVLSSVEFVQDYLQMRFDGPCLTAYTPPSIRCGSKRFDWNQPGYRDELCGQIGRRIERSESDEQRILIAFEGGAEVSISLRPDDYCGPEAVQFSLDINRTWVV
jgi:hypothetical protein